MEKDLLDDLDTDVSLDDDSCASAEYESFGEDDDIEFDGSLNYKDQLLAFLCVHLKANPASQILAFDRFGPDLRGKFKATATITLPEPISTVLGCEPVRIFNSNSFLSPRTAEQHAAYLALTNCMTMFRSVPPAASSADSALNVEGTGSTAIATIMADTTRNFKNELQIWAQMKYKARVPVASALVYRSVEHTPGMFSSSVEVMMDEVTNERLVFTSTDIKQGKKASEQDAARLALQSDRIANILTRALMAPPPPPPLLSMSTAITGAAAAGTIAGGAAAHLLSGDTEAAASAAGGIHQQATTVSTTESSGSAASMHSSENTGGTAAAGGFIGASAAALTNFKNELQIWAQMKYKARVPVASALVYRSVEHTPGMFSSSVEVLMDEVTNERLVFTSTDIKQGKKASEQDAARLAWLVIVCKLVPAVSPEKLPAEGKALERVATPFSPTSTATLISSSPTTAATEATEASASSSSSSASLLPPVASDSLSPSIGVPGVVLVQNGNPQPTALTNFKNELQIWAQMKYKARVPVASALVYRSVEHTPGMFSSSVEVLMDEVTNERLVFTSADIKQGKKASEQDAARLALQSGDARFKH